MIDFYHDRDLDYKNFKQMIKKKNWENTYKEKGGQTFAVEKIRNDNSENAYGIFVRMGYKIHINFGVARCHKEDNFVKKTGRDLAVVNMQYTEFTVVKVVLLPQKQYYTLESDKYRMELMFMDGKPFSRLEMVESK